MQWCNGVVNIQMIGDTMRCERARNVRVLSTTTTEAAGVSITRRKKAERKTEKKELTTHNSNSNQLEAIDERH